MGGEEGIDLGRREGFAGSILDRAGEARRVVGEANTGHAVEIGHRGRDDRPVHGEILPGFERTHGRGEPVRRERDDRDIDRLQPGRYLGLWLWSERMDVRRTRQAPVAGGAHEVEGDLGQESSDPLDQVQVDPVAPERADVPDGRMSTAQIRRHRPSDGGVEAAQVDRVREERHGPAASPVEVVAQECRAGEQQVGPCDRLVLDRALPPARAERVVPKVDRVVGEAGGPAGPCEGQESPVRRFEEDEVERRSAVDARVPRRRLRDVSRLDPVDSRPPSRGPREDRERPAPVDVAAAPVELGGELGRAAAAAGVLGWHEREDEDAAPRERAALPLARVPEGRHPHPALGQEAVPCALAQRPGQRSARPVEPCVDAGIERGRAVDCGLQPVGHPLVPWQQRATGADGRAHGRAPAVVGRFA